MTSSLLAPRISVVIPVLNEERTIPRVIEDLPGDLITEVVVVDNGSSDGTAEAARQAGARVVQEPVRGYGSACFRGVLEADEPDVVVFLDGDYSDYPDDLPRLVAPILRGESDLVIGSRLADRRSGAAVPPHARLGTRLAVSLMRVFFGCRYTDLGPFRAVRYDSLRQLGVRDRGLGWTTEMQARAAVHRLRIAEVPVGYRKRVGRSKISGTVRGTIGASYKILSTILRVYLTKNWGQSPITRVERRHGLEKVNLQEKLSLFTEPWSPKIVGELNGQYVKVARFKGEFPRHQHEGEDEMFLVLKGHLTIRLDDGEVVLTEGEFFIVPRGVYHQPVAQEEVQVVLFEPTTTLNTGNVRNEMTLDTLDHL